MKKIFSLCFILLIMGSAFAEPSIQGDFSLNGNLFIDNSLDTNVSSNALINLYLSSKSNNVKYTIKNATTIASTTDVTNDIEQAYIQFRIPYKENYLIFTMGKTPLDIGSDGLINSGTPFYINYSSFPSIIQTNPWIASMKVKLLQLPDFKSINMELILKLPVEDTDSKAGTRLTFDVNNKYFGTLEASFLSDLTQSILSGGINGTLFFDYGIYAKTDLQNVKNFEASLFLLKIISDYSFKFEALYNNSSKSLNLLPSLTMNINTKVSSAFILSTTYINKSFTLMPMLSINLNIVQGLDAKVIYTYSKTIKHRLSASISHKF